MDKKFVLIDKRFETITAKLAEVDVNFKVVNISLDDIETKLGELSMNAFHLGKTQIDLKLEFVNVKEAVLVNRVLLDECNDKIKVIAEAHEFNKGKFDEMEGIYSLKKDVDVLKLVATQHSEEIDRLRFAI
jgi:hypothetical protein